MSIVVNASVARTMLRPKVQRIMYVCLLSGHIYDIVEICYSSGDKHITRDKSNKHEKKKNCHVKILLNLKRYILLYIDRLIHLNNICILFKMIEERSFGSIEWGSVNWRQKYHSQTYDIYFLLLFSIISSNIEFVSSLFGTRIALGFGHEEDKGWQ